MEHNPSSSRVDRKTIEKNRRNHLKTLFSKLNSLIPHQSSREAVSLPDQLHQAANYIKKLEANMEKMKQKKNILLGGGIMARSPQIEIHEMGSALEIVLITGLDCQFMFNEIIRILHEDGAEVLNASFYVTDDTVFHTIHSKVGECSPGFGAARLPERLKKFVNGLIHSEVYHVVS